MPTCSPAPPATATTVPILFGTLSLDVRRGRPVLSLAIRCPTCRCQHVHGWGFDATLAPGSFPASPTHRVAHCHREFSRFRGPGGGYYVGPEDTTANAVVLDRYQKLMRDLEAPKHAVAPPA